MLAGWLETVGGNKDADDGLREDGLNLGSNICIIFTAGTRFGNELHLQNPLLRCEGRAGPWFWLRRELHVVLGFVEERTDSDRSGT